MAQLAMGQAQDNILKDGEDVSPLEGSPIPGLHKQPSRTSSRVKPLVSYTNMANGVGDVVPDYNPNGAI